MRNLLRIRGRIRHWAWERVRADALAGVIDDQRVPLRVAGVLIGDRGVGRAPRGRPWDEQNYRYIELERELEENSVATGEPWGPEVLAQVRHYLAVRKPREQLEEIRVALEKIGAALEANFTVSDILLRAGDPRADRTRSS